MWSDGGHVISLGRVRDAGHDSHDLRDLLLQLFNLLLLLKNLTCVQAKKQIWYVRNVEIYERHWKEGGTDLERSLAVSWHHQVQKRDPVLFWSQRSDCSPGVEFCPAWLTAQTSELLCPSRFPYIYAAPAPNKTQGGEDVWCIVNVLFSQESFSVDNREQSRTETFYISMLISVRWPNTIQTK